MTRKAALFSIRPRYVEDILSGSKTVELRRRQPKLSKGDLCLLYASSPVCAVEGFCRVEGILADTPERLWPLVRHSSGVTRTEFLDYFRGATEAVAISLTQVQSLECPIPLQEMREVDPGFRPPQSYRYATSICENLLRLLLEPTAVQGPAVTTRSA